MRGKQVLQIQYAAPALKNTPKNIFYMICGLKLGLG